MSEQPLNIVLSKLQKVRRTGPLQWEAICPAHPDRSPSLAITEGAEGKVLLHCHTGCTFQSILDAIGIKATDAFAEGMSKEVTQRNEIVAEYDYTDEDGTLIYQVVRYYPKSFRQRKPDGFGGWTWNMSGIEKTLYRLPKVIHAVTNNLSVLCVEGERDVETLERHGFIATTSPGGAGKWHQEYNKHFIGADVYIIGDRDTSGRKHAMQVMEELLSVTSTVTWLEPRAPFKDVTDHFNAGLEWEDLVQVDKLSEAEALEARTGIQASLVDAAKRIIELANDFEIGPAEAVRQSEIYIRSIEAPRMDIDDLWSVDQLIETTEEPYDWVIPGLLEHTDRVIVIATEGLGKSFWMTQIAALSSQGVHPFNYHDIAPIRTLYVDLENPKRNIRRNVNKLMRTLQTHRGDDYMPDRFHMWLQPAGINLLKPKDVAKLDDIISQTEPDLVCFGPLYKAMPEDQGKREQIASEVQGVFDYLRVKYNFALMIEHHAPKEQQMGRIYVPFGSSYWQRWPEFGIKLTPTKGSSLNKEGQRVKEVDVGHWRGPRDERCWPMTMEYGAKWPWFCTYESDDWRKWIGRGNV